MTVTDVGALGQEVLDVDGPDTGDRRLWSVTTILDVVDKPALMYWAANETADCAIDDLDVWQPMLDRAGRFETRKYIAGARHRAPVGFLRSNDLGSTVHAACEKYALTGVRPDDVDLGDLIRSNGGERIEELGAQLAEVRVFLDRFDEWLDAFQPTYNAAEVVVYSPTYGYAGTSDAFMEVDGVRFIVDYKTSREPRTSKGEPKRPYPETVLQLAAYRYAELAAIWRPRRYEHFRRRYYLLSPGEESLAIPVPEVDAAGCLYMTPERCDLFPMRADERAFEAFLFCQEMARWVHHTSKGAIGDPILPPTREVPE